jgi:predicted XRE-type DNA-binding protein
MAVCLDPRHKGNHLQRRTGKMAKFSLDALVNLATASGLAVHIQVAEAA